jgi:hypothetical protein
MRCEEYVVSWCHILFVYSTLLTVEAVASMLDVLYSSKLIVVGDNLMSDVRLPQVRNL